jgi:hypothetical protein
MIEYRRRLAATAAALASIAQPAMGAFTEPNLLLRSAVLQSADGVRSLQLDGFFHTEDLVQIPYPLHVLVWNAGGTRFVRYDLGGSVASGDDAALADGFRADEGAAIAAAGAPEPNAELVQVGARQLTLTLPPDFPTGAAQAQLFVADDEEGTVVSNPVGFWVR